MFKHKQKQTFIIIQVLILCRILSVSGLEGSRSIRRQGGYSNDIKNIKPATSDDIDTLLSDLDLGPDDLQDPGDLYQGQHDLGQHNILDLGPDDLDEAGSDDIEEPGYLYQDDLQLQKSGELLDLEKQVFDDLEEEESVDVPDLPPDFQMTDYIIPGDQLIQDENTYYSDIKKTKEFLPNRNYSPKQSDQTIGFEQSDSKGEMDVLMEDKEINKGGMEDKEINKGGMEDKEINEGGMEDKEINEGGMEDKEINEGGMEDIIEEVEQYLPLNKDDINSTGITDGQKFTEPKPETVQESEQPEIQPAPEQSNPDAQPAPEQSHPDAQDNSGAQETTEISTIPSTKPEEYTTTLPLPEQNQKMISSYKSEGKNQSDSDIEKMKETVLNDKLGMELLSVVEQIQEMQKEIADVLND